MKKERETELRPLEAPARRRPFIVLDIESKKDGTQEAGFTRPFMVGVYGDLDGNGPAYRAFFDQVTQPGVGIMERYYSSGGCVDRAMRFILSKRFVGHHVYAHNAGRFDYLFLLPWLAQIGVPMGYRFSIVPVASSIQVLDIWRGEATPEGMRKRRLWRFLDSYRLLPTSLDKIAKTFGLSGKTQHDLNLPETDPSWVVYNGQDCSELFRVLEKFHAYVEDVLLGEVGITAPATAMKIFRRNYLRQSVPRSLDTHEFVRRGYFGGRVEPFERQSQGLRYYDINSSYPTAMLEPMPAGEASIWEGEPPERFLRGRLGFVEADVLVPDMHVPPLPVRSEGGKLIFPVGRLSGVWEWSELEMALEEGAQIARWKKSVWYEPVMLFRDYVEELYKYRDRSSPSYDQGLAEVVKIMLNATYGKFGMKTLRRKLYLYDDPRLPDGARPLTGDPDSLVYVAEEESDAPYVMPQVAARVTALARVRLYRKVLRASSCRDCWPARCSCARGEFIAYTDTDSGITPTVLPTGSALGELKDEIPEHSGRLFGKFLGPKVYIISTKPPEFPWEGSYFEKTKAKGLERRDRHTVETLARGGIVYQKRLEKVGTLARKDFLLGPKMVTVPRRILPTEGKRIMHDDGRTSPLRVMMWR
jgi:hypothetical protein